MSDLLNIVERASESSLLLVEDYLARNLVGDQGKWRTHHLPPAGLSKTTLLRGPSAWRCGFAPPGPGR